MTTLSQIPADHRPLKRASAWSSLLEKPASVAGSRPSSRGTALSQDTTLVKPSLETLIAAEELALAAHIHSELMSIKLPRVSFACVNGKTLPCRAIGGDFFDAIARDDELCAVVADVSGKGVPAAIVAAMLQGIIHAQMLAGMPLTEIAAKVNEFLCMRAVGKFATMVLLKVQSGGTVEYVNCGHIPPILVNSASTRRLEGSNVVVGLLPAAQYTSEVCEMTPGDRMLVFTDGITEAENAHGEQFGDLVCGYRPHWHNVESIFESASQFQGNFERSDDWTLFELLYRGTESQ